MTKREEIERLPTAVRDGIKSYLTECMNKSTKIATDSALAYTNTMDEKVRANSLIAQGEHNAFSALYQLFK